MSGPAAPAADEEEEQEEEASTIKVCGRRIVRPAHLTSSRRWDGRLPCAHAALLSCLSRRPGLGYSSQQARD